MTDDLPPACDVGFKEWRGVCEALANGRQTLILRKGGIAENDGRFTPEHSAFWLYPTKLHEAQQGLRIEPTPPPTPLDSTAVPIQSIAVVDAVHHLDREEDLDLLDPFHVWTPETVHQRFHYRRPGLWVLTVRVWSIPAPIRWEPSPEEAGCKTWVPLRNSLSTRGAFPSLEDLDWNKARDRMNRVLSSQRPAEELE